MALYFYLCIIYWARIINIWTFVNPLIFCCKNKNSFCNIKATHIFSAKNITVFAVFHDGNFNVTLPNNFVKLWTTKPSMGSYFDGIFLMWLFLEENDHLEVYIWFPIIYLLYMFNPKLFRHQISDYICHLLWIFFFFLTTIKWKEVYMLIMSGLIWIYPVCKSLLLLPMAVKELKELFVSRQHSKIEFVIFWKNKTWHFMWIVCWVLFFKEINTWHFMNHMPSRRFTWNVKSYFLQKIKKKYFKVLSAVVMFSALGVNLLMEPSLLSTSLHPPCRLRWLDHTQKHLCHFLVKDPDPFPVQVK